MNDKILDEFINSPILCNLDSEKLKKMAVYFHEKIFPAGTFLFEEGDFADSLYYIVKGKLTIYKETGEDLPVEICKVGKNQFLGELAIIEDSYRSASACTETETHVLVLTKENFNLLLKRDSEIAVPFLLGIARLISLQLRSTTGQFASVLHTG